MILAPTPGQSVRWSSIRDPTKPPAPTRPVTVIVREGQMLYLPVGWWHYVQQIPDQYGKALAVNYWYDQEMRGHHFLFINYVRSLGSPNEDHDEELLTV